jgi:hypothetical protein
MKSTCNFIALLLSTLALLGIASSHAQDAAIHQHAYRANEEISYRYDDTDTTYCGVIFDNLVNATTPLQVQQIQLVVRSHVSKVGEKSEHSITVLGSPLYRRGAAASISKVAFSPASMLSKNFPSSLSYSYQSESYALSHLFDLFKVAFSGSNFMADPVSQFFFFKMQDVHQMQASALGLREGMLPGQSYVVTGSATPGLGGSFMGGDAFFEYVGVQRANGHRVALIRVSNLGNKFSTSNMHVSTNFTYQMLVALDGTRRGLLVEGSGQETAYPVSSQVNATCHSPVLQRQFSISLQP